MAEREQSPGRFERYWEHIWNRIEGYETMKAVPLIGPYDQPTRYTELLGVIPAYRAIPERFVHLGSPNPQDKFNFYHTIRNIVIQQGSSYSNPAQAKSIEAELGAQDLPAMGIIRGRTGGNEDVLTLFCIQGNPGADAFQRIREHVFLEQAKFN